MSKIPSKKDIKTEIKKLKELKPHVPRMTAFGEDNYAAIEAQIEVLEKDMDEDDIEGRWPINDPDNEEEINNENMRLYENARDAFNWLNGEAEEGSPYEGWAELDMRKKRRTK